MKKNDNSTSPELNSYIKNLDLSNVIPLKNSQILKTNDPEQLLRKINDIMEETRNVTATSSSADSSFTINRLAFSESQILGVVHTDEIHVTSEKLETVHIVMPLRGGITQTRNNKETSVKAGQGLVTSPGQKIDMLWAANTAAFSIQVPESTLRHYLADYFNVSPYKDIQFDQVFDWEISSAYSLRGMLTRICNEVIDPNSLLVRGITSSAVEEQLILTLIDVLDNNYSSAISGKTENYRPKHIKSAIEYITDNSKSDIRMSDLVEYTEVSTRTLQNGFQKHYGIGVMTYIRRFKLHQVREALRKTNPNDEKISDIVAKWGYYHASNFSKNYKTLFGEYPSDTLNSR